MRILAELLRIIVIFVLCGAIGWIVVDSFYVAYEVSVSYSWLGALAILILLFVYYRNKLQFTGWYKGEERRKLPRKTSATLISISLILMVTPILLSVMFS